MKKVIKNAAIKVMIRILAVVLIACGGYFTINHFVHRHAQKLEKEKNTGVAEMLGERLETAAELNSADYICTCIKEFKDKPEGWKGIILSKSFVISYEGTVKAGIKDLTKAKIKEKDGVITVCLPEVEITGYEIDKDSLNVYDESHNPLNQVKVEDVNEAQKELEEHMVERAIANHLLESAKENAETIVRAMLQSEDGAYEIHIEWQG